jgi:type VI protein secretion system component Hcp
MAIFLKLDTIKGDATATGHAGEIAVASVSYGASRSGHAGIGGA